MSKTLQRNISNIHCCRGTWSILLPFTSGVSTPWAVGYSCHQPLRDSNQTWSPGTSSQPQCWKAVWNTHRTTGSPPGSRGAHGYWVGVQHRILAFPLSPCWPLGLEGCRAAGRSNLPLDAPSSALRRPHLRQWTPGCSWVQRHRLQGQQEAGPLLPKESASCLLSLAPHWAGEGSCKQASVPKGELWQRQVGPVFQEETGSAHCPRDKEDVRTPCSFWFLPVHCSQRTHGAVTKCCKIKSRGAQSHGAHSPSLNPQLPGCHVLSALTTCHHLGP